jgi:DNA helicase HerA-like ATPase
VTTSQQAGQQTAGELAAAYATEGAAVELGAVVVDGTAHADARVRLPLSMLNRHGLVAGATGTGKTKTLQLMAEQMSTAGIPVFLADVKGDVSGVAAPGVASSRTTARAAETGVAWEPAGFPTEFLSLGGLGDGVPVRATMTSFGPVLLSKVLGLNATQESSLGLVFHYADKAGLPLLDLKDLRAVITHLTSDEGKADLKELGGLSSATAGVVLRALIGLEDSGGDVFFGEPEFDTSDLLRTAPDGRGVLSVMGLTAVQDKPKLFSTFLMWLLADLYHDLPEVGDVDKPKLVFFLDEAHLLFDDASEAFLDAIARTVRLVRSKGVGVFFVTQTPADVPGEVLAQLGNRVQHALRAFTPEDAKALKATVSTFPKSDVYDLATLLTSMGIGEAAVTILSERGAPTPVAWTRLRPPQSLMGPVDPAVRTAAVQASPLMAEYGTPVDRDSAYERLLARVVPAQEPEAASQPPAPAAREQEPPARRERSEPEGEGLVASVLGSSVFRSFARSAASAAGREISRSLFGTAPRRSSSRRRR